MEWFKRKPKPAPAPVDEQNWKAGDVAGCVEAGWKQRGIPVEGPKVGSMLLVTGVYEGVCNGDRCFGLSLTGWPNGTYRSDHFRKIVLTDTGADRTVSRETPPPFLALAESE